MTTPASIVIVDDSEQVRNVLATVLRTLGYRVTSCKDVDEAFEAVSRERPDLVLTDILLGAANGLDLVTRIRSDLAPPHPRFIACSGIPELEGDARKRDVSLFLQKPLTFAILRDAVAVVLADRPPDSRLIAAAAVGAKSARAAAADAARRAMARLEPQWSDVLHRAGCTVRWLPVYLGFGSVSVTLVGDDGLRVIASSDPTVPQDEMDTRQTLVRHVIETGSAMVVADASLLLAPGTGDSSVRLFAGMPLVAGTITVGALCLHDAAPRTLDPDDYDLLARMARRGSVVLGGDLDDGPPPFWEPSGLLTGQAFELLLASSLRRARRLGGELDLLIFEPEDPIDRGSWTHALAGAMSLERVALAERTGDRFGLLLTRPTRQASLRDLTSAVRLLRGRSRRLAGTLVSVGAGGLPQISEHELLRIAETTLSRQRQKGHRTIESISLRYDASVFGDNG